MVRRQDGTECKAMMQKTLMSPTGMWAGGQMFWNESACFWEYPQPALDSEPFGYWKNDLSNFVLTRCYCQVAPKYLPVRLVRQIVPIL